MKTSHRTAAPTHVLRLPGELTLRYSGRTAAVTAVLLLGCAAVWTLSVFTGTYRIDTDRILDVLAGGGAGTDRFIIVGQRLPRVCAALLVGAALGLSGALFQSLSRNPSAARMSSGSPPAPPAARSSSSWPAAVRPDSASARARCSAGW